MEQEFGNRKTTYQRINEEEISETNERNKLVLPLVITGIVLLAVILYFALTGQSHYERGVQYLHQEQYTEALVEFQKVDTDEKDFRMAQSKINYINGLLAYRQGSYTQAKTFLIKVEPSDEYYRESQLMLEKINLAEIQGNQQLLTDQLNQQKDTVIIKERVVETPTDKVGEAETSRSDLESVRRYRAEVDNVSSKFEALFQSARTASVESKKVFVRDMDSLYTEFKKLGTGSSQNESISEIRRVADSWMQKRLSYINRLIAENSVNGSNTLIALKEEGDKDYRLLQSIIRNNQF